MFASMLVGADLSNADLTGCFFDSTDLSGVRLSGANLDRVTFFKCLFVDSDFSESLLSGTQFVGCDLSRCRGLDKSSLHYSLPIPPTVASVDVATLVASRGQVPRAFLERCGVPSTWIEYLPDLVQSLSPIQLKSCMLSHSSRDHDFCELLDRALRDQQVPVYFAPKDMVPGSYTRDQLRDAVHVCDRLLLVLSNASMNSSWVRQELKWAADKERSSSEKVLFPISLVPFDVIKKWECLDDDNGIDLAESVRRYFIPDYSGAMTDIEIFRKAVNEITQALRNAQVQILPKVLR